jgi:hypothetical protein
MIRMFGLKNALSLLIVVKVVGPEGCACETNATVNSKLAPIDGVTLHSYGAYLVIQRL